MMHLQVSKTGIFVHNSRTRALSTGKRVYCIVKVSAPLAGKCSLSAGAGKLLISSAKRTASSISAPALTPPVYCSITTLPAALVTAEYRRRSLDDPHGAGFS